MAVDDQLLPPEVDVLRVLRLAIHVPPGALYPLWNSFDPSTDDKLQAKNNNHAVRVSVWDSRKTTPVQAVSMRSASDDVRVYKVVVKEINAVGAEMKNERMRVVPDPDGVHDKTAPGADGHSGIEGLDGAPGMTKVDRKRMLDLVAQRCVAVGV